MTSKPILVFSRYDYYSWPQKRRKRHHRHRTSLLIYCSNKTHFPRATSAVALEDVFHGATSAHPPSTPGKSPLPVPWDTEPPRRCHFQPRVAGANEVWRGGIAVPTLYACRRLPPLLTTTAPPHPSCPPRQHHRYNSPAACTARTAGNPHAFIPRSPSPSPARPALQQITPARKKIRQVASLQASPRTQPLPWC
ncbi:unnamed protein product [Ectocarpus sp. 12 AP-2014]